MCVEGALKRAAKPSIQKAGYYSSPKFQLRSESTRTLPRDGTSSCLRGQWRRCGRVYCCIVGLRIRAGASPQLGPLDGSDEFTARWRLRSHLKLRVKSLDELNSWLLDKCVAYSKVHKQPEIADRTVWQIFEDERGALVQVPGRFDGFHATTASVSKTCLVRFDTNKYSVSSRAVGRPVEVQAYADRIVIRQDGVIVAEHARCFGRNETIYDPWHYVPVLARKPGALRNGAPSKDWLLPASLERVRRKLKGSDDGDRQMVAILSAVLMDGLVPVEAACAEAIDQNVHSADVILNILARKRDPAPTITILTPDAFELQHAP